MNCFIDYCIKGNLKIVKNIYEMQEIKENINYNELFTTCCFYGQLEIVKWLYSLSDIEQNLSKKNIYS